MSPAINPFESLIQHACEARTRSETAETRYAQEADDVAQQNLQKIYEDHRRNRNREQKAILLVPDSPGVAVDFILQMLEDASLNPRYVDSRNSLAIWARPTQKVKGLVQKLQQELLTVAPNLWLMPLEHLHSTVLEVDHSRTEEEIEKLVTNLCPVANTITNYTCDHRPRVIKPLLSFDRGGIALTFVPAAGEGLRSGRSLNNDAYSYHHLRRDVWNLANGVGIVAVTRYVVPSCHLTIGRFITDVDHSQSTADGTSIPDINKLGAWISTVERLNSWLETEYWPHDRSSDIKDGGEWVIGEERGLDIRHGRVWYGTA